MLKICLFLFKTCFKIVNCFNANNENFVNFSDIFCIFNKVKRCTSFFANVPQTLDS